MQQSFAWNVKWIMLLVLQAHPAATATAKSPQSYPTLCDPIDGSLPGCPVPGILQAKTLEWVAISFSSAWKWKVKVKSLSCVQHPATPWTAAYQAPPSMGFSRQEYWSGVPLPSLHVIFSPLIIHNLSMCVCERLIKIGDIQVTLLLYHSSVSHLKYSITHPCSPSC